MKRITIFLGALLLSFNLLAQFNDGIDALNSEMYPTAKLLFKTQFADSTKRPEACYYLGETYRLSGNKDSAAYYYELGMAGVNANPLCSVGKAGLIMSSDPTLAADLIKKAKSVKAYKKNAALYVAIAKAYAQNKQFDLAFETLNFAKDLNKKYTPIYIAEGDIFLKQNKPGDAAAKLETAIYYDENCKPAYLKVAQIYFSARNFEQSQQYLDRLRIVDAHFSPAVKLIGDIAYEKGKYAEVVAAYAEYLQSKEAVLDDQIRYAFALFFNKEYSKSIEQVNQLIPLYPTNLFLKRILAYNSYETENYAEGLTQMQDFLNKIDQSSIIYTDYKYYARLLFKNNQDSLSVINYKKAMELSTTPQEFYKEISSLYKKMKDYPNAILYLEKHINSAEAPLNSDYFNLGQYCYSAASVIDSAAIAADSTQADARKGLFTKADSLFGEVAVRTPESYLGYFWRARVNSNLDPETTMGLAKPYYEKVVELLEKQLVEQPEKNGKKEIIESYQYLGYFYFLKQDFENSKVYWNKILLVNPTHAMALQALEGIKEEEKK